MTPAAALNRRVGARQPAAAVSWGRSSVASRHKIGAIKSPRFNYRGLFYALVRSVTLRSCGLGTCSLRYDGDNSPMRVRCQNCGEELIGAVNRCWQCGTAVAVLHHQAVPPIRRTPVDLHCRTSSAPVTKAGSIVPVHINDRTRTTCAHATVWVGAAGCLIGVVSVWSVFPATVGIVLGILGMKTRRRDLASTGLVISVLALFLGFAQFGYDMWTKYQSQQLIDGFQEQRF